MPESPLVFTESPVAELPARHEIPNPYHAGQVELSHRPGEYHLRVKSDCGVVKVYSSRDGCMAAMNSYQARQVARELYDALMHAADVTDIRGYGYIVDKEGRRV